MLECGDAEPVQHAAQRKADQDEHQRFENEHQNRHTARACVRVAAVRITCCRHPTTRPHTTVERTPDTWIASAPIYEAQATRTLPMMLKVGSRSRFSSSDARPPNASPPGRPPRKRDEADRGGSDAERAGQPGGDGDAEQHQTGCIVDEAFALQQDDDAARSCRPCSTALAATASGGETMAPSAKHAAQGNAGTIQCATTPTTRVVNATAPTASCRMMRRWRESRAIP